MRCPRCDWRSDRDLETAGPVRDQVAEHLADTGHPTCELCRRILPPEDDRICEACISHVRNLLSGIGEMYAELENEVAQPRSASPGGGRGGSDGPPLPGGDALVMLGPGSQGLADDALTVRDRDTSSLVFDLTYWESSWRQVFTDPPRRPARFGVAVGDAVAYLTRRARDAAHRTDLGFVPCAADLTRLHVHLERITGRARAAAKANASCFDCGGTLLRRVDPKTGLEETEKTGRTDPDTGRPEERPVVTCSTCRRRYGAVEYLMALRDARESGLQGWVTISDAAKVAHRSVDTLKSWTRSRDDSGPGPVSSCCLVVWTPDGETAQGRQLVWWPDVEQRADRAQRRTPAAGHDTASHCG